MSLGKELMFLPHLTESLQETQNAWLKMELDVPVLYSRKSYAEIYHKEN